jgi:hypothetical protein
METESEVKTLFILNECGTKDIVRKHNDPINQFLGHCVQMHCYLAYHKPVDVAFSLLLTHCIFIFFSFCWTSWIENTCLSVFPFLCVIQNLKQGSGKSVHSKAQSTPWILGWVGCILLRYNEMGDFCCTINATYIFYVISYYTLLHNMFRLLLSHLQVWLLIMSSKI